MLSNVNAPKAISTNPEALIKAFYSRERSVTFKDMYCDAQKRKPYGCSSKNSYNQRKWFYKSVKQVSSPKAAKSAANAKIETGFESVKTRADIYA